MFEQFLQKADTAFEEVVNSGTDQELFIASYLQGHFDLVVSQALQQQQANLSALDELMQQSLSQAFANKELEQNDQQQVLAFWQQLLAL